MCGTVFATEAEAIRAGAELLRRWWGPTGVVIVQVEDEPNYVFPENAARPCSLA